MRSLPLAALLLSGCGSFPLPTPLSNDETSINVLLFSRMSVGVDAVDSPAPDQPGTEPAPSPRQPVPDPAAGDLLEPPEPAPTADPEPPHAEPAAEPPHAELVGELAESLMRHEGLELEPYPDGDGLAIGYGHRLTEKDDDTTRITEEDALRLLGVDMGEALAGALRAVGLETWRGLDTTRQAVIGELAFARGAAGLRGMEDMIAAIQAGDFGAAAAEVLDTGWAERVGFRRAAALAYRLQYGSGD